MCHSEQRESGGGVARCRAVAWYEHGTGTGGQYPTEHNPLKYLGCVSIIHRTRIHRGGHASGRWSWGAGLAAATPPDLAAISEV